MKILAFLFFITFITMTSPTQADSHCTKEWPSAKVTESCSLTYVKDGQQVTIETGVFTSLCTPHEDAPSKNRCLVIRTCGLNKKNEVATVIQETKDHLQSLCIEGAPFQVSLLDKEAVVDFQCQNKRVNMVIQVKGKRKTCPLPFKMP